MKNAILIPGRPDKAQHYDPNRRSNSEDFWFSWLKRRLILQDIHTISIEPPLPFRPRYDEWKKEFERCDTNPDTLLVGHSCGGGFIVRYLSEHKSIKVGKVILAAPWINPNDDPAADTADFFHFDIDPEFPSRTDGVAVFISSDDYPSVIRTVEILRAKVSGLVFREYSDRGHFTRDADFPELFKEAIQ
jgi:predicted alpha/beta hydrolase family esterase